MRSRMTTFALLTIATQLLWTGWAGAAQYPQPPAVSPFNTTGFIQAATLDNPADVLSGGTVTVNGTKITIPRNIVVVMSATNLTWQELWAYAPCPWGLASNPSPVLFACANGNGQTGLAMSDKDPATGKVPLTTYEITIMGNRIGNGTADPDYVGAIAYLAQHALNLGTGFINHIDYATGTLHVGGVPGVRNDARDTLVQINDPAGRFGRVMSPDARFTADTDNPTIRARTGYPMCIPRDVPPAAVLPVGAVVPPVETDLLCPQRNRPLDPDKPAMPLGNFTLCNPGAIVFTNCWPNFAPGPPLGTLNNAKATVVPFSDATNQAPLQVGDYLEYSGTIQQDDLNGTATGVPAVNGVPTRYVSAWNIVDNVGIYTSSGAVPAYLAMEVTLLGVGGTAITAPIPVPQEVTTRIKAVGFFTDPTRTVDVFAVIPDPCTGIETESLMLGRIPNRVGGVPWGRFRDIDQFGLFPITRQWRARYTPIPSDPNYPNPPDLQAANGLDSMAYTIPVAEFITGENLVYGDPTLLVIPQNFQDWPFLAQGEGPWRGNPANIVGQLTPFPLTNSIPGLTPGVPGTQSCPANQAPIVKITPPEQTVPQNNTVILDASQSTSPAGATPLSFRWLQSSGPGVVLFNANTSKANFKAPSVAANTALTFLVTVTDTAGLSSTGSTLVEVTPKKVGGDTVTIAPGGIVYRVNRGVLNATATSSDSTCSAILTLTAPGTNLPAGGVLMTPQGIPGPGVPCTYLWASGKQIAPAPTSATVTSTLGGSATATVFNGELVIK